MARLSFWGGVGTVTGSKYLVETDRHRVLVDCGLFQGLKELRERNWHYPPFDPRSLTAVVLTHAHTDHAGYLPRLVKEGFRGPIHCSRGTAALCRILLPDSGRLQEEEAEHRNRHQLTRHKPAQPLYTERDAYDALELFQPVRDEEEELRVASDIHVRFENTGHLLGSRSVLMRVTQTGGDSTILFSGDLGRYDQPILKDPDPPLACDYLLVESTYGDRLHAESDVKGELARVINETAARGGVLLIPAFAVGRTQEVVYTIRELEDEGKIPVLPVRVDSPMANAATRAYEQLVEEHDGEYTRLAHLKRKPLSTRSMRTVSSRQESKELNAESGARILISASGMMTGGRVVHHAQRILPDSNATILFVGFQAKGTTGRRILDGEPEVKLYKQWTPVRCKIERIEGMSSHPDYREILRWLDQMSLAPKRTFITHGEPEAALALSQRIIGKYSWEVTIPDYAESFEF